MSVFRFCSSEGRQWMKKGAGKCVSSDYSKITLLFPIPFVTEINGLIPIAGLLPLFFISGKVLTHKAQYWLPHGVLV